MIAGSDEVTALIQLITNVEKGKARLADLQAANDAAAAREQAAVAAETSLAQRTAALDLREAAVRDQELAAHRENQRLEGTRAELVEFARQLRETDDAIKVRLLRHAGLLDGFNPNLQSLPSWAAVDTAIFSKPADAVFDDDSVNVVVEPVPGAPAGATITRQRRPMRRTSEERI